MLAAHVERRMLKTVEKYELIDEIGHGGMATVYRARDTRLDRDVALKIMHPHLQGAREARQRFAREALTVARLRHPFILEIYDYSGDDSEVSFIATELLTGPTLKRFVEEHPGIPAELAACIALQVARALGAAHAERVIHRDVKPENVMLHENRCVKLTDFGIAQLVDVQSMTTTGQVLGSPGHMAPEQIEGKECDARTDLFSLGTVLYLLATGTLPFTGNNPHQVLKRIMEGRFQDPLQACPAIGNTLAGIIRKLLALDPEQRYQTASDLERDLLAFVAELGIDAPDQTLAEYLKDPAAFGASFRARSIERLTQLGERAQRAGKLPVALDHFNRVLALDESNERVLAAVQRLGRRSQARKLALRASAAALVLGAATFAYLAAARPGASIVMKTPATPGQSVGVGSKAADPSRPKPATPAALPTTAPTKALASASQAKPAVTTTARPRDPEGREPQRVRTRVTPAATRVDPGAPRLVTFNPSPANVAIGVNGGKPVDFGPSFRSVELPPGTHRFKFVGGHDCCIDEEITVKIPPGDEPFTVEKRLAFRPAGLYVVTNTPANVFVDGDRISGRSRSVIRVPNVDSLIETHRIRVTADGHVDAEQDVRLRAGQVVTVPIRMAKAGS